MRHGEQNRDGHNENFSWNNGVEGPSHEPVVLAARRRDLKALLSTLFATRGTIQLTAGDEFGRTQHGNNNAYAQDNEDFWIDWAGRDISLEEHVAALAAIRGRNPGLANPGLLSAKDVTWLAPRGGAFTEADWRDPDAAVIGMRLRGITVLINRGPQAVRFVDPEHEVPARSVVFVEG